MQEEIIEEMEEKETVKEEIVDVEISTEDELKACQRTT
jgi:hypothetical protein